MSIIQNKNKSQENFFKAYGHSSSSPSDEADGLDVEDVSEDSFGDESVEGEFEDVNRDQILSLFQEIQSGERALAGGLSQEEALEFLRQALRDEAEGNDAGSSELYFQVAGPALGESGDGEEDGAAEENPYGPAPTKVEGNVYYYELTGQEEQTFQGSGQDRIHQISGSGNLVIVPQDPEASVEVQDLKGDLVIKIKQGGTVEKFIIDPSEINSIHIASDNVEGSLDEAGIPLTMGVQETNQYAPQADKDEMANALRGAIGQIGYYTYTWDKDGDYVFVGANAVNEGAKYMYGVSDAYCRDPEVVPDASTAAPYHKMAGDNMKVTSDVKEMLGLVADALEARDYNKSQEAWKKINEKLAWWGTQRGADLADDSAQFFFNIMYGELGEEKLTKLLQEGVLPAKFVDQFATQLEGGSLGWDHRLEIQAKQHGGTDWTHATTAEFIRRIMQTEQATDPWDNPYQEDIEEQDPVEEAAEGEYPTEEDYPDTDL